MKRVADAAELRPIDGEFKSTPEERKKWCAANNHPLVMLNLSLSGKLKREIKRCICGEARTA